jgi:hypothetical protein
MVLTLIAEDRARDRAGRIWVRVGHKWSRTSAQPEVSARRHGSTRPRLARVDSMRSSLQPGH